MFPNLSRRNVQHVRRVVLGVSAIISIPARGIGIVVNSSCWHISSSGYLVGAQPGHEKAYPSGQPGNRPGTG
jgi:hypothetical protein